MHFMLVRYTNQSSSSLERNSHYIFMQTEYKFFRSWISKVGYLDKKQNSPETVWVSKVLL